MESVRSARKLFLADWSRSELSSEEILEIGDIVSGETINYITAREFAVSYHDSDELGSKNHCYMNCTKRQPVSHS